MATCGAVTLLLCVAFAIYALTEAQQEGPRCIQHGGICMMANDCAPGNLSEEKGLCEKKGHECCYGMPMSEHRCQKRGGHCRRKTECPLRLRDDRALDCEDGEVCCTLVT